MASDTEIAREAFQAFDLTHLRAWDRSEEQSGEAYTPLDHHFESVDALMEEWSDEIYLGGYSIPDDAGDDTEDKIHQTLGALLPLYRMISQLDIPDGGGFQTDRRYWLLSPGRGASKWNEFSTQGYMAIGFNRLKENLQEFSTKEEVQDALVEATGEDKLFTNDALALYEFAHQMKPGDVIIPKKGRK